jgi:hypothetical protein
MMPTDLLEKIASEAEQLSVDEQLELAARLIARVRQAQKPPAEQPEHRLKWRDIRGIFPHPSTSENIR